MPLPNVTASQLQVIAAAFLACRNLVDVTRPDAGLAGLKNRGRVSSRAKWLLNELGKLDREIAGVPEPEAVDPDLDEIAAQAREIRESRRADQHRGAPVPGKP